MTFRYGVHSTPVLERACLRVRAGEHVAVVGPSGIGKSTLAAVLAGHVTPEQGDVRFGGVRIDALDAEVLRHDLLLVPQESYVFSGSLRENLTYLAPEANDRQLDRAVRAIGADTLIGRRGGYDAVIDPNSLSHGERQLITLTRVYLSPARVLILDEATSQLDPGAEAQAEQAMAQRGGTLVVIAHRMSSALRADRIVVVDGLGLHVGIHEELLRSSGTYVNLVGHWQQVGGAPTR